MISLPSRSKSEITCNKVVFFLKFCVMFVLMLFLKLTFCNRYCGFSVVVCIQKEAESVLVGDVSVIVRF